MDLHHITGIHQRTFKSNMTIDKFGSHILNKNYKIPSVALTSNEQKGENITIVDINKINLFYYIVLPFIGNIQPNLESYKLGQEEKTEYISPLKGVLEKIELDTSVIKLYINAKEGSPGVKIDVGDKISFQRNKDSKSYIRTFYGELIIKCPVLKE